MKKFELNCHGCCEPLNTKYDVIKKVLNPRRVSVNPFADVKIAAEALENKYIFSWKPHPAYLASPEFDPQRIRKYIQETLNIADGGVFRNYFERLAYSVK